MIAPDALPSYGGAPNIGGPPGGPPDALAAILSAAAAPGQGPDPSAAMGAQAPAEAPPDAEGILREILDLAGLYKQVASDDKDMLLVEKATTLIQQVLADRQATHDQAMGPNASLYRRLAG